MKKYTLKFEDNYSEEQFRDQNIKSSTQLLRLIFWIAVGTYILVVIIEQINKTPDYYFNIIILCCLLIVATVITIMKKLSVLTTFIILAGV